MMPSASWSASTVVAGPPRPAADAVSVTRFPAAFSRCASTTSADHRRGIL